MESFHRMLPHVAKDGALWLETNAGLPAGTGVYAAAALFLVLAVVLLRVVMNAGSSVVTGSSKRRNLILLLGESGAGKTVLLHQLLDGEAPPSVSSLEANQRVGKLHAEADDGAAPTRTVVDFPGHKRLRASKLNGLLAQAKAIVFVLDASDSSGKNYRDVAEFLYDLQTNKVLVTANPPPVLIACNKTDVPSAAPTNLIRARLEDELNNLKASKTAVTRTGEEDNDEAIMLGTDGEKFSFDEDATVPISFARCAAKAGAVDEVVEFIQGAQ